LVAHTVWLVCDISGSMIEGGKRLLMRGLTRQVEQFVRLDYCGKHSLRLVLWNDKAVVHPWDPSDELPAQLLDCQGSAKGEQLVELLSKAVDDKILIFSDGFWSNETRQLITDWKHQLPENSLRIVRVGADATERLRGADVFDSEDFFSAIEGWLAE